MGILIDIIGCTVAEIPCISASLDATAAADLSPTLVGIRKLSSWQRYVPGLFDYYRGLYSWDYGELQRGRNRVGMIAELRRDLKISRGLGLKLEVISLV
jgi:hypothetical protein